MINEETPYKLAEIIRDTWPQLFKDLQSKDESDTMETHSQKQNDGRKSSS